MNIHFAPRDGDAEGTILEHFLKDDRGVLLVANQDERRRLLERVPESKANRVLVWYKREHLRGFRYPHLYILGADRILRELFFPGCIVASTMSLGVRIDDDDPSRMFDRGGFQVSAIG